MNITCFRSFVGLAVFCSALCFGRSPLAATSGPADLLAQAYTNLAQADHDYQGHRVKAMKQIAAAGKLLGLNLHGHGKGHEKQGVSDDQLRAAQALLAQARPGLNGKALKHVDRALQELSIALKIK